MARPHNHPILNHRFVIGVTGRIGSGKTTVTDHFSRLGIPVVDADVLAKQLTQPGQPCLQALVAIFGPNLLDPNGQLQRTLLRQLIFHNPQQRQQVERILHPAIHAEMQRQLQQLAHTSPYQIAAIPLLFETQQTQGLNRILVVDAPDPLIYHRLLRRSNLTKTEVDAILATQTPRQTSLANSDDIISNAGDPLLIQQKVITLHKNYLQLSKSYHETHTNNER